MFTHDQDDLVVKLRTKDNILTNILRPRAHVFLPDELKACLQFGSLEKCPSKSKHVPITNIPLTTPITVNSTNHNL